MIKRGRDEESTTEGPGGARAAEGAGVEDCLSGHTRLLGASSTNSFVVTWAGGISSNVGATTVDALGVHADPGFSDDLGERTASVFASLAILVMSLD